jgi:hypothetical protein
MELTETESPEQTKQNRIRSLLKSNEFKMKNFQRTKVQFLKSLVNQIEWPLLCFAAFVDNSVQSFEY